MLRIVRALVAVASVVALLPAGSDAAVDQAVALAPRDGTISTPHPSGDVEPNERASQADDPDGVTGPQTHVIYFVPRGGTDHGLDLNGTIGNSIRSMLAWFKDQTGGKRPRMDRMRASTEVDTSFVLGEGEAASYRSLTALSSELQRRGFNDPKKRYLVYAELGRGNICGEGSVPLGLPGSGQYSAIYLGSASSCGARNFGQGTAETAGKAETIIAQEWLHNEGVVSAASPHHCVTAAYHVCTGEALWLVPELDPERVDVMFPIVGQPLSQKVLDRDRDDYLDHPLDVLMPDLRDSTWLE